MLNGALVVSKRRSRASRSRIVRLLRVLAATIVMGGQNTHAQELEPRAYANLPVGLNFLQIGYAYTWGEVLFDPVIPLENVEAKIHRAFLAYVHALNVAGKSGTFRFVLPYAWLSASGDLEGGTRRRNVSGFADPTLGFSINLIGAPALSAKEFANYRQNLNVGVSFFFRPPLGRYDSDRLANIGTNRWAFRTETGLSKVLGRWIVESILGATFFTENNNFLIDRIRDQAPIYSF